MSRRRYVFNTQAEARKFFRESILPVLKEEYHPSDTVAFDEGFNNWVDGLVKGNEAPERAYDWSRT